MSDSNLVYILDGKIYINLTNMCTNDCVFCLRRSKDDVCGQNMLLKTENISSKDVISQLKPHEDKLKYGVTFCGYGEPTLKFAVLKETAEYIKKHYPDTYIKVNTNGHGSIVNKKDILSELGGLIDEFSVSLNAQSEDLYNKLCFPKIKNAYGEMLAFAKSSVKHGFKTTLSVVSGYKDYEVDIDECRKTAESINAQFRNREWIKNGY